MAEFEKFFREAVKPGPGRLASGFAFAAANIDGSRRVQKSYGTTTISGNTPFPENPFSWVASLSKLVTAIATLQCIEKRILSLDEDVLPTIPELVDRQVITSFDSEKSTVIVEPARGAITVRKLITHTNGAGYDAVQPPLLAWRASRNETFKWNCGDFLEAFDTPLVAHPGAEWRYSPGFDWVGLMIERKTKMSLEDYFLKHIFAPLGIAHTVFDEDKRPDLLASVVSPTRRTGAKLDGPIEDGALDSCEKPHWSFHSGGAGLYSTPSDYLTLLSAVLRQDKKLLQPKSYEFFTTNMLNKTTHDSMNAYIEVPFISKIFSMGMPTGQTYDFGAGTLITTADVPGKARKGTFGWVSTVNNFWFIDPESGYCGVYFQQLSPAGDDASDALRGKVREYLWSEFVGK